MNKVFLLLLSVLFLPSRAVPLNNVDVDPNRRIDCDPDPGSNQQSCESRGCVWDPNYDSSHPTVPLCYFPPNTGYASTGSSDKSVSLSPVAGSTPNPYGSNFDKLTFSYKNLGSAVYIQIAPDGVTRYRPPVPLNTSAVIKSTENLIVETSTNSDGLFAFNVHRDSDNVRIWDTSIGGLLFSDQYIQISTYLPTDKIYGFGETIHKTLKHDFTKYTTWGMFARDQPPDSAGGRPQNLYGVHPFYLGMEANGKAHGVFIFNSNAQEVTTGPAPHLTYRTIGGQLEIYFFPGPTPEAVIQQYQQVIGTPFLPAYWGLGFQLCRYGYSGVQEVIDTVNKMRAAGIPQDVQFADIDYMERYKDFTYDHDKWGAWPNFTDQLHDMGMKVTLIFDPAIEVDYDSFQRGLDQGATFISWPREDLVMRDIQDQYPLAKNTVYMLGVVWPDKHVAFPDFLDPQDNTNNWWANEFKLYHDQQAFDGIWIDMNEPSNFGTNDDHPWYYDSSDHPNDLPLKCPTSGPDASLDIPPYLTTNVWTWGGYLATNTLCMLATTMRNQSRFYDTKNLYGWSESKATYAALKNARGKRGVVISRSTFPSSGQYAGHWLGDNTARWEDLQTSVIGAQEFNLFGIPYVGSDICGFIGTSNEELCLRWQQMGAFHSFSRNHNTLGAPAQDPTVWPTVAAAARQANLFRYRHLPYLYSLHFAASLNGGTVLRPVFFEFPDEEQTLTLSYEFMWGSGMLIAPVVTQGATSVDVYLPTGSNWYSLFDYNYGQKVNSGRNTYPAPWTSLIPVFLRAGYILPRQDPALTTVDSRKNPFGLVIGIGQNVHGNGKASGQLYWDDGESWVDDIQSYNYHYFTFDMTVTSSSSSLVITKVKSGKDITMTTLDNIEILGHNLTPDTSIFYMNGKEVHPDVNYSASTQIMNITQSGLIDWNSGSSWTLQWKNKASRN